MAALGGLSIARPSGACALLLEAAFRNPAKGSPYARLSRCLMTCTRFGAGAQPRARIRPLAIPLSICRETQWQKQQQQPRRIDGGIRTIFTSPVITHYVDVPPNYRDEVGLPFRRKDLELHEVAEIFGPGAMSVDSANRLLRILHGRRVAGTLEDPGVQRNTARFPKAQRDAALAYLRRTVPVDELINAGLRAEDELAELERQELEREAAASDDDTAATAKEVAQGRLDNSWQRRLYKETPQTDTYGVGALDVIRAKNRAKWEEEVKRREEEQKRKEEEEAQNTGGLQTMTDGTAKPPREMSLRLRKWSDVATSQLREPPRMSKWARLWPSYLFVLSLLAGGTVLGTQWYTPPRREDRLLPDVPPAAATVGAIVLANLAVWALWHAPPMWRFLNRYMMLVPATPRPLSLLGAVFSHQKFVHLLGNMLFLWFVGVRLHDDVGRAGFLQVYLASGALGYLATMTGIVLRGSLHLTSLGASGAIYGVSAAYFWLHRFEGFKILGLPPDPYGGIQGLGFIGLMLGLNILALTAEKQTLDLASHFAGIAVGVLYGQYFDMKAEERKAAKAEGRPERPFLELLVEKLAERK